MNNDWIKRLEINTIELNKESDWVHVKISEEDIQESIRIGNVQEDASKALGLRDNAFDGGGGKSLERTITSKQAEFAVRAWGGGTARVTQPNEFHDYPDVGQLNVRYIFDKEDGLMIMKRDQGNVPLVLVCGKSPDFYLIGWVIPNYAKYKVFKINSGRESPIAGFLLRMQPHEACAYSRQWLLPMWSLSRDLAK